VGGSPKAVPRDRGRRPVGLLALLYAVAGTNRPGNILQHLPRIADITQTAFGVLLQAALEQPLHVGWNPLPLRLSLITSASVSVMFSPANNCRPVTIS
jgi:hypothetical protein